MSEWIVPFNYSLTLIDTPDISVENVAHNYISSYSQYFPNDKILDTNHFQQRKLFSRAGVTNGEVNVLYEWSSQLWKEPYWNTESWSKEDP